MADFNGEVLPTEGLDLLPDVQAVTPDWRIVLTSPGTLEVPGTDFKATYAQYLLLTPGAAFTDRKPESSDWAAQGSTRFRRNSDDTVSLYQRVGSEWLFRFRFGLIGTGEAVGELPTPGKVKILAYDDSANVLTFAAPDGYQASDVDYIITPEGEGEGIINTPKAATANQVYVGDVAVPVGGIELYVRAIPGVRARGLSAVSTRAFTAGAPNQAPAVTLVPSATTLAAGAMLTLTAAAVDPDGSIPKVEFRDGAGIIGEDTTSPFTLNTSTLTVGVHELRARAYDNSGAYSDSLMVEVTITPAVVAEPTLASITPSSGPVGTAVVLGGSNLAGATAVTFNGTAASIGSATNTQVQTTVPAGASSGNVVVTTPGGTAQIAFTVSAPATVPAQVTGLTATPGNGQVSLSWSAPANGGAALTGYKVYRNTSEVGQPTGTSYTDTGRANGTQYSYTVAAVNSVGTGPQSASATATPQAPTYNKTLNSANPQADGAYFVPAGTQQLRFDELSGTGGAGVTRNVAFVDSSDGSTSNVSIENDYDGRPFAFDRADGSTYYGTLPTADATIPA